MFDIDWMSLTLPLAYVLVLGGSLMTFSTIYRKRKAGTWMGTPPIPNIEVGNN